MKILRKTIKWVVDWDNRNNFVEIETTEDGKEYLYVKPLVQPSGLIYYLDGGFDLLFENY